MIRFDIVTICKNAESTIERTFRSIGEEKKQTPLRLIVIDAFSIDKTLDIIKDWAERGVVDDWISEKDQGIYDGMNKGIALAEKDRYVIFINADDELAPGALAAFLAVANEKGNPDYLFGNSKFISGKKRSLLGANFFKLTQTVFCNHQALAVKATVLKELNGFDRKQGLSADVDMMWKLVSAKKHGERVNQIVAHYWDGGVSSHSDGEDLLKTQIHNLETFKTLCESSRRAEQYFLVGICRRLRHFQKKKQYSKKREKLIASLKELVTKCCHGDNMSDLQRKLLDKAFKGSLWAVFLLEKWMRIYVRPGRRCKGSDEWHERNKTTIYCECRADFTRLFLNSSEETTSIPLLRKAD